MCDLWELNLGCLVVNFDCYNHSAKERIQRLNGSGDLLFVLHPLSPEKKKPTMLYALSPGCEARRRSSESPAFTLAALSSEWLNHDK